MEETKTPMTVAEEMQLILLSLISALARQPGLNTPKLDADTREFAERCQQQHPRKPGQLTAFALTLLASGAQLGAVSPSERDSLDKRISDAMRGGPTS